MLMPVKICLANRHLFTDYLKGMNLHEAVARLWLHSRNGCCTRLKQGLEHERSLLKDSAWAWSDGFGYGAGTSIRP